MWRRPRPGETTKQIDRKISDVSLVLLKASFYHTILLIENKCPGSKGKISYYNQSILMFYKQRFLSPVIWLIFFSGSIKIFAENDIQAKYQ